VLDAAAEPRRAAHAVEELPVDAQLVRGVVAQLDEPRLDVDLARLDVQRGNRLLARVKDRRGRADHYRIRFRKGDGHLRDLPHLAKLAVPHLVELRGDLGRRAVVQAEDARVDGARPDGFGRGSGRGCGRRNRRGS